MIFISNLTSMNEPGIPKGLIPEIVNCPSNIFGFAYCSTESLLSEIILIFI